MTTKKLHVSFNTNDYVNAHGKAPRGRGVWLFFLHRDCSFAGVYFASAPLSTFTEAKKQCLQWVKQKAAPTLDYIEVFVGS